MQEVYLPLDWNQTDAQDPREKTLMGSLKKFFGRYLGPKNPTPALVYLQEEKVSSQPQNVRLPWFLPYEEFDTGTGETPVMRMLYRRALSFPPVKAAVLNKLFGVAALKLQIHPADKHNDRDRENADTVRWNLVRRFRGGMTHLTWQVFAPAMADGYSVNEKIFGQQKTGKYAGKIALTNLKQKDVGWDIVPKTDTFSNITGYLGLRYNGGREFHPADFVHYAHLPMYERPTGMSDYRAAYDAMWLYDTAWKLRRIQLTTKSFPILMGMYEKEAQQPGLNQALRKAKALNFMTVPKGCMVQALDIAGASLDVFRNTIQDLREEIVMAINGAFLTQMAAGENVRRGDPSKHQSVTDLFKWFLSECICGYVLNDEESGLIKEIVDLNHVASEYPYASLDAVSWEEMKQLAEIVDKAKEWGLPISEEWAYEKFALEAPHDDVPGGDQLGGNMPGGMPGAGGPGAPPAIGPDGQPLPPDPNAPPPNPGGATGTGGSPIDAEPHKAFTEFADKGGWEPAVRMGHRGGLKGGPARARALPPERRHEIAVQGGKARQQGSHAVGIKKHDEQSQPVVTVETPQKKEEMAEGGFDESKHPRDDKGQWVRAAELHAAQKDPVKANALRSRVVNPKERMKLERVLSGHHPMPPPEQRQDAPAAPKPETPAKPQPTAPAKQPQAVGDHGATVESAVKAVASEMGMDAPVGTVMEKSGLTPEQFKKAVGDLYKAKKINVVPYSGTLDKLPEGAISDHDLGIQPDRSGVRYYTYLYPATAQQSPQTPGEPGENAASAPAAPGKTQKSGLPPKKAKPSFATREDYDKALEAEYDKATGGKQVSYKETQKIVKDIQKRLGKPPAPKPPSNPVPMPKPPSQQPAPQTPAHPQQPAQAPVPQVPAPQQPSVNLHDPASLASAVHEAARSIPDALGGHTNTGTLRPSEPHKPLIADVYDAMKAKGQLGDASIDDFKQALLKSSQSGNVTLERNDLPHNVSDTPAGKGYERSARGEIQHGPAQFHVIDTNSKAAKAPAATTSAQPAAQPTPQQQPSAPPPEAVAHLKSLRERFAAEVASGGGQEAKDRLAAVDKLLGVAPAVAPAPAPTSGHAPGSPEHVSELVNTHGVGGEFAPMHKLRAGLAAAGITGRAAQDAAIKNAYMSGHVHLHNAESSTIPSPEESGAYMPRPGDEEFPVSHLSLRKHSEH